MPVVRLRGNFTCTHNYVLEKLHLKCSNRKYGLTQCPLLGLCHVYKNHTVSFPMISEIPWILGNEQSEITYHEAFCTIQFTTVTTFTVYSYSCTHFFSIPRETHPYSTCGICNVNIPGHHSHLNRINLYHLSA